MEWLDFCYGHSSGVLFSTSHRYVYAYACLHYFRNFPRACVVVVLKLPRSAVAMSAALGLAHQYDASLLNQDSDGGSRDRSVGVGPCGYPLIVTFLERKADFSEVLLASLHEVVEATAMSCLI